MIASAGCTPHVHFDIASLGARDRHRHVIGAGDDFDLSTLSVAQREQRQRTRLFSADTEINPQHQQEQP